MQKVVNFQREKENTELARNEKLRELYKKDFSAFVEKREKLENTIFSNNDTRKRM